MIIARPMQIQEQEVPKTEGVRVAGLGIRMSLLGFSVIVFIEEWGDVLTHNDFNQAAVSVPCCYHAYLS